MHIRILIVDDEKEMVEILKRHLQPVSSLIESTDELDAALMMAETSRFNLIILDLKLRLTGKEEALHAIRKLKSCGVVVVVVSGLSEPNIKEEVMAAGADAFVSKDGSFNSRSLLLAASIATLHLPRDSFMSDTFTQHVDWLRHLASA